MEPSSLTPSAHHIHHHPAAAGVGSIQHQHHLDTPSPHHHHSINIGHGHNHLHDDSHIHINCNDNSSHSISPPNSNSNTTISCGSGNSTSANIGVPTSRNTRTSGVGGNANIALNNNNKSNHRSHNKSNKEETEDYENYRNRTSSGGGKNKNRSGGNGSGDKGHKMKKSILEDDFEKSAGCSSMDDACASGCNNRKFKQRPPFINPNQEFLPICDALFNMISLAAYFCDVVFDVLTVYTWYNMSVETEEDLFDISHTAVQQRNRVSSGEVEERVSTMPRELMWQWSLLGIIFICLSCFLSQLLSFKWYKNSERRGQKAPDGTYLEGPPPPCSFSILVAMHISLVGVLWRYFKLFIPVDLGFVKNEVRDLCLLRLIHAFCQAAPMLLLQLYLIWHEPGLDTVSDLMKVSSVLSLFSVDHSYHDPNITGGQGGSCVGGGCSGSNNGSAASSSAVYGPMYTVMKTGNGGGRMMVPFWRRPLSLTLGSENEGSVSSRIDIQQKLQEKKQQQLTELREIEEEIKQDKLKRPELHEMIPEIPVSSRQAIPVEKKQPWFGGGCGGDDMQHPPLHMMMIPSETHGPPHHNHNEILLDPQQYLMYASASVVGGDGQVASPAYQMMENGSAFYYSPEWPVAGGMPNYYEPLYQNGDDIEGQEDSVSAAGGMMRGEGDGEGDASPPSGGSGGIVSAGAIIGNGKAGGGRFGKRRGRGACMDKGYFDPSSRESIYKGYRIPSDIDSQMSLPRSYTLPREFKYKKKFRKPVKTENFLPSTNSSDGDVDSGEDAEGFDGVQPYPLPLPSMHHIHHQNGGTTPPVGVGSIFVGGSPATVGASPITAAGTSSSSITPAGAARQSRKMPSGGRASRYKLHETKL